MSSFSLRIMWVSIASTVDADTAATPQDCLGTEVQDNEEKEQKEGFPHSL